MTLTFKKIRTIILLLIVLLVSVSSSAQKVFMSLDSLLTFVSLKSTTLQSGEIKLIQAKKAKLAAIVSIIDPTINLSYAFTDNTTLPTSLFPSETFGGAAGTYKEVRMGIQYNSNLTNYNEIKLLNLPGWANFKLSKLNIDLTENNNKMTQKSYFENIAGIYFNIVNLQEQVKSAQKNLLIADTLMKIADHKFQNGQVNQQDVNSITGNFMQVKETVNQLNFLLENQYLSLKALIDIPETVTILIKQDIEPTKVEQNPEVEFNDMQLKSSLLQEKSALTSLNQSKSMTLPTISVFNTNTTQQYNTQAQLYSKDLNWYQNSNIGVKVSFKLPTANNISQTSKARYDYKLARNNSEHLRNKTEIEHLQLHVDFRKAVSQWTTNTQISELQEDTYNKNKNLYAQGLLSLDQTLNSYNSMISSNYNRISSAITVLLVQSKIAINNNVR